MGFIFKIPSQVAAAKQAAQQATNAPTTAFGAPSNQIYNAPSSISGEGDTSAEDYQAPSATPEPQAPQAPIDSGTFKQYPLPQLPKQDFPQFPISEFPTSAPQPNILRQLPAQSIPRADFPTPPMVGGIGAIQQQLPMASIPQIPTGMGAPSFQIQQSQFPQLQLMQADPMVQMQIQNMIAQGARGNMSNGMGGYGMIGAPSQNIAPMLSRMAMLQNIVGNNRFNDQSLQSGMYGGMGAPSVPPSMFNSQGNAAALGMLGNGMQRRFGGL